MSMIRQCDRCGAVFTPYRKVISDHEKKPTAFVGVSIGTFNYKTGSLENDKITTYDLCPKCSRQLNAFMEIQNTDVVEKQMSSNGVVKHECLRFGIINKKSSKCKLCPSYQECKKATEEKKENKQKGCKAFGAFGGTPYCLTCPQCNECRDVANSIKEASSNGEQSAT